jgi:regulator of protease activity HflC (stomatin/prohibitin superfamily)
MSTATIAVIVVAALTLGLVLSAVRIVREHQRDLVFRLGRLRGARGPGLVLIIPLFERTRWVNLQVDAADIPPQDLITKDDPIDVLEAVRHQAETLPLPNGHRQRLSRLVRSRP